MADSKGPKGGAAHDLEKSLEAPDNWLVRWGSLKKIVKTLLKLVPKAGPGIKAIETPDGIVLTVDASTTHAFQVLGSGEAGSIRIGKLFDGISEHVPDLEGADMDVLNGIDLTGGGVWLYLKWESNVSGGELLDGGSAYDVAIVTAGGDGELPTASTDGELYIHLWQPGMQYWKTGIRVGFCRSTGYSVGPYGSV